MVYGKSQLRMASYTCMYGISDTQMSTANIMHFMLVYLCSVEASYLDANATGLSFCRSAAPSPLLKASTWMVIGLLGSKYARVISLQIRALIHWKLLHGCSSMIIHFPFF